MTTNQDTDTTATDTEWTFPLDRILDMQRDRINPDNEDFIPFTVEAWRTGDHIPRWTTIVDQTDEATNARDAALMAAQIMAASTDADYLVFAYDTHATTLVNNPKTGEPWKPGEMQAMCDEEGFCETGLMRDNLVITVARRCDGKLLTQFIPYHFHKGEPILYEETRLSEWDGDSDGVAMGRIPETMRAAITQPSLDEQFAEEIGVSVSSAQFRAAVGIGEDEFRCRLLIGGAKALLSLAMMRGLPNMYVFLIPAFNELENRLMAESGMSGFDEEPASQEEPGPEDRHETEPTSDAG